MLMCSNLEIIIINETSSTLFIVIMSAPGGDAASIRFRYAVAIIGRVV
jgi:hypothetical protein